MARPTPPLWLQSSSFPSDPAAWRIVTWSSLRKAGNGTELEVLYDSPAPRKPKPTAGIVRGGRLKRVEITSGRYVQRERDVASSSSLSVCHAVALDGRAALPAAKSTISLHPAGAFTEHGEVSVSTFFHGQKFQEMPRSSYS